MALDPRLILSGALTGVEKATPTTSFLGGIQAEQQLAGEDQRQRLLEQQAVQQAVLAPLQQQALAQDLAVSEIKQQRLQKELDLLGVPDVPTAKELAFNTAKLSALPTLEAKLKEIDRLKSVATAAGRTTDNLDSLQEAYSISEAEGDQLLDAAMSAFRQSGLLMPDEEKAALSRMEAKPVEIANTKTEEAAKVLNLNEDEKLAFSVLDPKKQDELISKALDPKEKRVAKEDIKRTEKGLNVRKQAVNTLKNILDPEKRGALRDVVGPIEGRFDFRLQGDEADMVAQIKELGDVLTADNLDLMSGVLSESDIALLKNLSAGGLNRAVNESTFVSRASEILQRLRGEIGETGDSTGATINTVTLPNGVQVKRVSTGVSG
jgi:hypothetical protein